MRNVDFATHYEALGVEPGASDQEIARAKRAYNELYHSDRLAHMSGAAQTIAAEKVRAANEAARVLLDPSVRAGRDLWVRERSSPVAAKPPPREPSPVQVRPIRRTTRVVRMALGSVAVGALLGVGAFLLQDGGAARRATPAPTANRDTSPSETDARPAVRPPTLRSITDSMITIRGDGGWTAPVAVGGASWRASFIPESDNVMYRVRTNGTREYVLNSEPGFRRIAEDVRSYEFSSLTGKPVLVRYSRWPRSTPPGTVLHTRTLVLPADGAWSQRVWLGPLGFRWDVDRPAGYEVRDDEGRISRVPPSVRSVAFGRTPVWIRFRSTDSLPLSLTFRYTVP